MHLCRNSIAQRVRAAVAFVICGLSSFGVAAQSESDAFKDWVKRCDAGAEKTQGDATGCYIAQNLVIKEGNQRILLFTVAKPPGKGPVAILTFPLGIALPPGVVITVDGGQPQRFEIERCLQSGCKSAFPLDEEMIRAFKRGLVAEVVIRDAARSPVTIPVSLQGFTAAFASLPH
ncbi:MAG: invasion associated locus B family protein [Gammaproteobacteria bacterium]|nr:invasion associated locus B family protein [Gammaproteobacteria bacterium]